MRNEEALTAMMLSMRGAIRAAAVPGKRIYRETSNSHPSHEPRCAPRTKILMAYTDDIFELMDQYPDIRVHPVDDGFELDDFLDKVERHNVSCPPSQRIDPTRFLNASSIVQRRYPIAEAYVELLKPCEQLRLKAAERRYQRYLGDVLRKKEDPKDALAIELKAPIAMATSLVTGMFLSFICGYFGAPYLRLSSPQARAIAGFVLCLVVMIAEIGLIIIRYVKNDRINYERERRHFQQLEHARRVLRLQIPKQDGPTSALHPTNAALNVIDGKNQPIHLDQNDETKPSSERKSPDEETKASSDTKSPCEGTWHREDEPPPAKDEGSANNEAVAGDGLPSKDKLTVKDKISAMNDIGKVEPASGDSSPGMQNQLQAKVNPSVPAEDVSSAEEDGLVKAELSKEGESARGFEPETLPETATVQTVSRESVQNASWETHDTSEDSDLH